MTVPSATGGAWRLRLAGHELTATASRRDDGTDLVVAADGRVVATRGVGLFEPELELADLGLGWDLAALELEGGRLVARSWRRGELRSCRVVVPPGAGPHGPGRPERIDLEPPVGSRARRGWEMAQRHPRWYAARHVAAATAQVLLGLVAVSLLVRWISWDWLPDWSLPDLPLPSIPLPSIPLPSIPWPDWSLPDVTVPGWLRAVLESKKYWFPVLVAVVVAVREVRRRRRRQEQADRDAA